MRKSRAADLARKSSQSDDRQEMPIDTPIGVSIPVASASDLVSSCPCIRHRCSVDGIVDFSVRAFLARQVRRRRRRDTRASRHCHWVGSSESCCPAAMPFHICLDVCCLSVVCCLLCCPMSRSGILTRSCFFRIQCFISPGKGKFRDGNVPQPLC